MSLHPRPDGAAGVALTDELLAAYVAELRLARQS
jgi:hypothetical protein